MEVMEVESELKKIERERPRIDIKKKEIKKRLAKANLDNERVKDYEKRLASKEYQLTERKKFIGRNVERFRIELRVAQEDLKSLESGKRY